MIHARWNDWVKREDWQLLRNRAALPRAWVVHQARRLPPANAFTSLPRQARIKEILYPGDALWSEPGQAVYDPRTTAWVEADALPALSEHLQGGRPTDPETVTVRYQGPQRVELEAHLDQPGSRRPGRRLLPGLAALDRRPPGRPSSVSMA